MLFKVVISIYRINQDVYFHEMIHSSLYERMIS